MQAQNYTKAARTSIDLVVIHSMEAPEKGSTAENVAAYFANQPKSGSVDPKWCKVDPKTGKLKPWAGSSAHYNIDSDSIVGSVREHDVAWHAPGANHNGIGLEHAGYARQTEQEWLDLYSVAMLMRSAELCAEICLRWRIPIVRVTVEDLKTKKARGICGHNDCTLAFGGGTHWDPGPHFPWDWYIEQVQESAMEILNDAPPTHPPPAQADLSTPIGIQSALEILGCNVGPVDGIVGTRTRAAIKDFQAKEGLTVDGIVGPKTRQAMTRALAVVQVFTSQ